MYYLGGGKVIKSQTTACLTEYCEEDCYTGKVSGFGDLQGPSNSQIPTTLDQNLSI